MIEKLPKPSAEENERQALDFAIHDINQILDAYRPEKLSGEDRQLFREAMQQVLSDLNLSEKPENQSTKDFIVIRSLDIIRSQPNGTETLQRFKEPFYLMLTQGWHEAFASVRN